MILTDEISEKAVIGYLLNNSAEEFYELNDFLSREVFTNNNCAAIYGCLKNAYDANLQKVDIPVLLSTAKEEKVAHFVNKKSIEELMDIGLNTYNPNKIAASLKKLHIYRVFQRQLLNKQKIIEQLTGQESISEFLALTEFDVSEMINQDKSIKQISDGLVDRLKDRLENPVTHIGISTGYKHFDKAIGGGLRDGSVNVITARVKVGKSHLLNNAAINIAMSGVPVLYIDTEMMTEEQQDRCIANFTKVNITDIETGQFGQVEMDKHEVLRKAELLKDLPYFHCNVSGMPFEEQFAIISKWVKTMKKPDSNGEVPKVVVIYDYLKMTTDKDLASKNIAEHQILGFMMTSLHNLAVRLKFPILTAVQSNRDGIDKESTGIAAGSDRILWLCTNFSIFKFKSEEELAYDGFENGNRKMVVMATRHGPGLSERDYINYNLDTYKSILTEGKTRSEIEYNAKLQRDSGQDNTEV